MSNKKHKQEKKYLEPPKPVVTRVSLMERATAIIEESVTNYSTRNRVDNELDEGNFYNYAGL